jgi:hypothetical protein
MLKSFIIPTPTITKLRYPTHFSIQGVKGFSIMTKGAGENKMLRFRTCAKPIPFHRPRTTLTMRFLKESFGPSVLGALP